MDDFVLDPNDLSEGSLMVAIAACESEFDMDDFVLGPNDLSEGGFSVATAAQLLSSTRENSVEGDSGNATAAADSSSNFVPNLLGRYSFVLDISSESMLFRLSP